MDYIHLTGIRCYGYTGYLPEEQVLGQWFEVDVKLWLDISTAGKTDAIEDTLDYRSVISLVQHLVKTSKFALVEKLVVSGPPLSLEQRHYSGRVSRAALILATKKYNHDTQRYTNTNTTESRTPRPKARKR